MVFYDHIKGVLCDNGTNKYYFVKFNNNAGREIVEFGTSDESFPLNIPNNYGEFITTGSSNDHQKIVADKQLQFGDIDNYITGKENAELTIRAKDTNENSNSVNKINLITDILNFTGTNLYFADSAGSLIYNITNNDFTFNHSVNIEGQLKIGTNVIANSGTISCTNLNTATVQASNSITVTNGYLEVQNNNNGYIMAPYFVATSDKRYKENFKPLPSVLDFITSTSLYTFNYKSSPEDRNIGIIAQDVENYNLDDFNLVLNIKGEKGEFKAVKESKIPYILWKGIQEESGKISRLEEENAALAKKVDKLEKLVDKLIKLTGSEIINEITEE